MFLENKAVNCGKQYISKCHWEFMTYQEAPLLSCA